MCMCMCTRYRDLWRRLGAAPRGLAAEVAVDTVGTHYRHRDLADGNVEVGRLVALARNFTGISTAIDIGVRLGNGNQRWRCIGGRGHGFRYLGPRQ